MAELAMEISRFGVAKIPNRLPAKEAWARYVHRRWPYKTAPSAQAEWDLTADQARGLALGHASMPTIEAILAHKRGGRLVELAVMSLEWGVSLESLLTEAVEELRGKACAERRSAEETDKRLAALGARLRADVDVEAPQTGRREDHLNRAGGDVALFGGD